jgi:hypothetical protein
MYLHIHVYRFVEHELMVEKELGTIEWKARESIQQKEAAAQEQGKDIHLLEMGGEEASGPETNYKTGKHEYTHHLR